MVIFCHQPPTFLSRIGYLRRKHPETFRVLWIFSKKFHGSLGIKQWLLGTDEAFCTWCFSSQNVQNGEFYPADFTSVAEKGVAGYLAILSSILFQTTTIHVNLIIWGAVLLHQCGTLCGHVVELTNAIQKKYLLIQARMNPIIMSCFTKDLPWILVLSNAVNREAQFGRSPWLVWIVDNVMITWQRWETALRQLVLFCQPVSTGNVARKNHFLKPVACTLQDFWQDWWNLWLNPKIQCEAGGSTQFFFAWIRSKGQREAAVPSHHGWHGKGSAVRCAQLRRLVTFPCRNQAAKVLESVLSAPDLVLILIFLDWWILFLTLGRHGSARDQMMSILVLTVSSH